MSEVREELMRILAEKAKKRPPRPGFPWFDTQPGDPNNTKASYADGDAPTPEALLDHFPNTHGIGIYPRGPESAKKGPPTKYRGNIYENKR